MDYKTLIDRWAIDFKISESLPGLDCIIPLLITLSIQGFKRNDLNSEFYEYVSSKFIPVSDSIQFLILKQIIEKQVISASLILKDRDAIETAPIYIDHELLKELDFDVEKLGMGNG